MLKKFGAGAIFYIPSKKIKNYNLQVGKHYEISVEDFENNAQFLVDMKDKEEIDWVDLKKKVEEDVG